MTIDVLVILTINGSLRVYQMENVNVFRQVPIGGLLPQVDLLVIAY